ncbi:MAG TPA: hypothetical protein VKZ67_00675 [Natronosporangium sp.]|nr:hypothetical protein [Natronosporangium sp.]
MPGKDTSEDQRQHRLSQVGFWVGAGLTPLAAVLWLIGGAGQRLGGALGMLALAAVGLSMARRPQPTVSTNDWDDRLLGEFDALRAELRAEIVNAAQANRHALNTQVAALKRQLAEIRAETAGPAEAVRPASAVVGAVGVSAAARVPPTGAAGWPGDAVDPGAGPHRYRGGSAGEPLPVPTSQPIPTGGIYRHTETVQVTRSTYVDRSAVAGEPAESYLDYREPDDRTAGHQRAGRWREEHTAAEHRDWDNPDWGDRWSREADRERWQPSTPRRPAAEVDRWSGAEEPEFAAGRRWATVRASEDGRELQFAERRVARHRDGSADEVQIEDRWATVQRSGSDWDDPRSDGPRYDDPGYGASYGATRRGDSRYDDHRYDSPRRPEPAAALPAGGSWQERWEQAPARSRRYREPDERAEYASRRSDFEFDRERWR